MRVYNYAKGTVATFDKLLTRAITNTISSIEQYLLQQQWAATLLVANETTGLLVLLTRVAQK